MHRSSLSNVNCSLETVSTDSDNDSMSSNSIDEPLKLSPVTVSASRLHTPRSTHGNKRSPTALIGTAASSIITYALMDDANLDSTQANINVVTALGAGVAANVLLNSKLLQPLIDKVDEWIIQGIQLCEDWVSKNINLVCRRHSHISLENRIWKALKNNRKKVTTGGFAMAGITYTWKEIIQFFSKLAPEGSTLCLEKMADLRIQLDTIINSPAAITASAAAALATVAYGMHIAYGASQQLKELNEVSFLPVKNQFDQALNKLTASLQSPNASAARINAAFKRLELAATIAHGQLKLTRSQLAFHHNAALEKKDRVDLVKHTAIAATAAFGLGALYSGVKAAQGGAAIIAAAKVTLSTKSATLSFLFLVGCGSCMYGSHQCQLVIDKCEELEKEAQKVQETITASWIDTKENMEVLLERMQISN